MSNAALVETIWTAADFVFDDESEAVVVTNRGNCGFLASGRYTKRASALRAQRKIIATDGVDSYLVTRGKGDEYVIEPKIAL